MIETIAQVIPAVDTATVQVAEVASKTDFWLRILVGVAAGLLILLIRFVLWLGGFVSEWKEKAKRIEVIEKDNETIQKELQDINIKLARLIRNGNGDNKK